MDPMTATEARAAIAALRSRCTEKNSSPELRRHLDRIVGCFDASDDGQASELVEFGAGHVADTANLDRIRREHPGELAADEPALWADEEATAAYLTLSDVRFRYGYLTRGVHPSNLGVFRRR